MQKYPSFQACTESTVSILNPPSSCSSAALTKFLALFTHTFFFFFWRLQLFRNEQIYTCFSNLILLLLKKVSSDQEGAGITCFM